MNFPSQILPQYSSFIIDAIDSSRGISADDSRFFLINSHQTKRDDSFDLATTDAKTQEKILGSAHNFAEWVRLKSSVRKEVVEKCAFAILKKKWLHLSLDYFQISSEEMLLRYLFQSQVIKKIKVENPAIVNRVFVQHLPPLKMLTTIGKMIEIAKSVFNSIYFKVPLAIVGFALTPQISGLVLYKVSPFVLGVTNKYLSFQIMRIFEGVYHLKRFLTIFSAVGRLLTPKDSYANRCFSVIKTIIFPFSIHSLFFYPRLSKCLLAGLPFILNFKMRDDRDAEAENLFVSQVLNYQFYS